MLSSALLKYACNLNTEGYADDQERLTDAIKGCITLFIIAVIIDLVFVFYALWCLFNSHLPWYLTALLIVCMLYPGLGFMVAIGIIVYYHMVVLKKESKGGSDKGKEGANFFYY